MSRIVRHTVSAPAIPRWLRPRLTKAVRQQLALIQLQKLADVHQGVATEETLWDLLRDALTWSRAAELLGAGHQEMTAHLGLVTCMVEHYGRTGRVEFTSQAQDQAARMGCAYMEDLAELVDRETANAAAAWSEERVAVHLKMGRPLHNILETQA